MDTDPATTRTLVPERVPPTEWPALGAFIFRSNRTADGRVRCLHGDQGGDERSHVAELVELRSGEAAFWRAAGSSGETLGVIGCEIDGVQRRAWIRGPWAVPGPSSAALESALLHTLELALPEIHCLDAFPSEDDEPLATLYRDAGYRRMDVHRVMQAALGDAATATTADPRIRAARPEDVRQWLPLHHGAGGVSLDYLFHSRVIGDNPDVDAVGYIGGGIGFGLWGRTTVGDHYVNGKSWYGIKLDVGVGNGSDLFFTHFSFMGFDPRGKKDRYTNYYRNNRHIALINRAYCMDNPRKYLGYGAACWGLSAGINSGGGRPLPRRRVDRPRLGSAGHAADEGCDGTAAHGGDDRGTHGCARPRPHRALPVRRLRRRRRRRTTPPAGRSRRLSPELVWSLSCFCPP